MPGLGATLRTAAHPDLDLWAVGAGAICLAMFVGALFLLGAIIRADVLRNRSATETRAAEPDQSTPHPGGEAHAGDEARRLDEMLADQRRWS